MNPWGLLIMAVGILLIIMAVKGSYSNVVSAISGKPSTTPNTGSQSASQGFGQGFIHGLIP